MRCESNQGRQSVNREAIAGEIFHRSGFNAINEKAPGLRHLLAIPINAACTARPVPGSTIKSQVLDGKRISMPVCFWNPICDLSAILMQHGRL